MGWRSRQGVAQLGVLHQLYHNVCARRVCGRGRAPSLAVRLRADAVFAGDMERFTGASRAFLALVGTSCVHAIGRALEKAILCVVADSRR